MPHANHVLLHEKVKQGGRVIFLQPQGCVIGCAGQVVVGRKGHWCKVRFQQPQREREG